jgi:hypothetical protein
MTTESDAPIMDISVGEGNERQSGRTTAMLNVCIDAVLEGQPKCVVIGAFETQAHYLRIQFQDLLCRRIPTCDFEKRRGLVLYEGSEIRFIGLDDYQHFIRDHRGFGEFWDHAAEEKLSTML